MLFNSFSFAIFLPIVFIIYWAMPNKYRWLLLFVSSYLFYMSWNPKYVFLIFFSTLISYYAGIAIEKEKSKKRKKLLLVFTVALILIILFFYKYFNFVIESIESIVSHLGIKRNFTYLNILLPVGISFYTFQTLSYVIDIYKGNASAEHHFGIYATFISFFPQLVAGPIERTNNLLPQIKKNHKFDYVLASYGLKQMAWGFFKKIVIADSISQYTNTVFANPYAYQGFSFFIVTFLFAFQIYCDFSGYSDIAIGTAKLLGIKLMTNFNCPYFSESIKEFWSRWHISLSQWFRDYVYIPLGGNRVGRVRNAFNLLITFLVSGLWHGANWTYVIWGGIHGVAQILEKLIFSKKRDKKKGLLWLMRVIGVFIFSSFAWIFFSANNVSDAIYIIRHMIDGIAEPIIYLHNGFSSIGLSKSELFFLLISLCILVSFDYFSLKMDVISVISSKKKFIRWSIYVIFLLWMILNIPVMDATEFIYFQF